LFLEIGLPDKGIVGWCKQMMMVVINNQPSSEVRKGLQDLHLQ
jgi:hypothetical protein